MSDLMYLYQHLPFYINPDLELGPFSVSWYSMMYLVAFAVVYLLLRLRIRREEFVIEVKNQSVLPASRKEEKDDNLIINFLIYVFIGLIIGARLGEIIFYNFSYYMADPIRIVSPFDPITGEFVGIYGMSYHGGLIGVLAAALIFCRQNRINFWRWADFIIPAVPAGYFFGRLGNFINGELYGRVTGKWWGMYFPEDPLQALRHPSQFYEAFLEGMILFLVLWPIRNKKWAQGRMLVFYLGGYAFARIIAEFFREPEKPSDVFWGAVTVGQLLSLGMLLAAVFILWKNRKNLV